MTTSTGTRVLAVAITAVWMQITIVQGEVKNSELKTAIEAVDAIPANSTFHIEGTTEAETLRLLTSRLASQSEIDDLVQVLSSDPTERNSWQVIARAIGGNVGFKKEQLPVLKRLFVASIRSGQHWLTEGRSGHRDYTSHQLRTELAIQINVLVNGKRDIPESNLLAEDPSAWLKSHLPEKTGETASSTQDLNPPQDLVVQGALQGQTKDTKETSKNHSQKTTFNLAHAATYLLAGVALAYLLWLAVKKKSP